MRHARVSLCLVLLLCVCSFSSFGQSPIELKLPFGYGETWLVARGYNCAGENTDPSSCTHKKYSNADERYALDFVQSGCDSYGRPVRAAASGTFQIVSALDDNGWGVNVYVVNTSGCRQRYAHMIVGSLQFQTGQYVHQGDIIGLVGNTGNVFGTSCPDHPGQHLHFVLECKDGSGNYVGFKPEPMSNYAAFIPGTTYISNNGGEIGYWSDGWHTDGTSQKFFDAYVKLRNDVTADFGNPRQNPNNPQGPYIHLWTGAPFNLYVQDFYNPDFEKNGHILWREGAEKALVIRAGFDFQYVNTNGPVNYGAAQTNEGCWTDPVSRTFYQAAQQFERALMLWNPSMGSQIQVRTSNLPTGIIQTTPCGSLQATGFYTGSSEKTLTITAVNVSYNHAGFTVGNLVNLAYDYLRLFRNGVAIADYAGNSAGFTDYSVATNQTYSYYLEGGYDNWGTVSVTEAITLTTPPNPNTFTVTATTGDARSAYIRIQDTLYQAPVYNIYRDGRLVARTSGREYGDFEVEPETTYSYMVDALDWSFAMLGSTGPVSVTTPASYDPPPPTPDPPQDPVYPIRLVDGEYLVNPAPPDPVLINSYATINFTIENVGSSSIMLDRVRALAYCDLGVQQTTRNYPADQFLTPLTLAPGERYTYQRDNRANVYPGIYGICTVEPLFKIHGIAGEQTVTDLAALTSYVTFEVLESNVNPDLTVTAVTLTPVQPIANDSVSVTFTVTNQGDRLSPTPQFSLTLPDGTVQTQMLPQIDVGQNTTVTFNLGSFAEGVYPLSYSVDPLNVIHEWNEANNTGSFYIGIASGPLPLPNLRPSPAVVSPANPTSNDVLTATARVNSIGGSGAGPTMFRLALDGGMGLWYQSVPALAAGASVDIVFTIGPLSAGIHTLGPLVDVNNDVVESDESDNWTSSNVTITQGTTPPDGDHDGIPDSTDNCPNVANANQANADGDSFGDVCDACPNDPLNDVDHDGVCGNMDNCPTVANANQLDSDGDGLGDACDLCFAACDDGNVCTTDSCNPSVGCVHTNNTASCDDGNACTTNDTCSNGTCAGGAPLSCSDGNVCTTDSCNPATGCVYTNNTAPCSDGSMCTTGDTCSNGVCVAGSPLNCNDSNPCTSDSCNVTTGCVHSNNTAPCNDGNACTTSDVCSSGVCTGGVTLNCSDSNPCTDDSCNLASGCVHTNNTAPCSDGNACTTSDTCSAGTCAGGQPLVCNDGSSCTTDTCNVSSGCVYTPNNTCSSLVYTDAFNGKKLSANWQTCGSVGISSNKLRLYNTSTSVSNCPAIGQNLAEAKLASFPVRNGAVVFDLNNGGLTRANNALHVGFGSFAVKMQQDTYNDTSCRRSVSLYGPGGTLLNQTCGIVINAGRYEFSVVGTTVRFRNVSGGTAIDVQGTDATASSPTPLVIDVNEDTVLIDNLELRKYN